MARLTFDIEPDHMVAGQPYAGHLVVRASGAQSVPRIAATVVIHESWKHSYDTKAVRRGAAQYSLYRGVLAEALQLADGETRIPIAFQVPIEAPPTHATGPVTVECTATVDGGSTRRVLLLRVHRPPVRAARGGPVALGIPPAGASTTTPRVELALPATTYAAGEWIEGRVAAFGEREPMRELVVTFAPYFHLRGWLQPLVSNDYPISQRVVVPQVPAGTVVPFAVQIPVTRAPSLDCQVHAIEWRLVVRSGSVGADPAVRQVVPITIVPAGSELGAPGPMPALSGRDDFAQLAALAATAGWRFAGSEAVRASGSVHQAIGLVYRDDGTLAFAITHGFAPLGIALRVTAISRLRNLFSRDVDIGLPDWDRAHRVETSNRERAAAFLHAAVTRLAALPELALGAWTDATVHGEVSIARLDADAFAAAAATLAQVHQAIDAARAMIAPAGDTGPYR